MPSDAKKKQQQKKKEAAKARQTGKKPVQSTQKSEENGKVEKLGSNENGTNGAPISEEGIPRHHIWIYLIITILAISSNINY